MQAQGLRAVINYIKSILAAKPNDVALQNIGNELIANFEASILRSKGKKERYKEDLHENSLTLSAHHFILSINGFFIRQSLSKKIPKT